jgi:hypothetical protein
MFQIRNNSSRAKIIIIILIAHIVVNVLDAISLIWQHQLLVGVRDHPEAIDMAIINNSDAVQQVLGYIYIGLAIVSIIFFIMWFRRAYYNVHEIPDSSPSFTEGWAAGSWFIPFMNLVRPYQIMKEIWLETQRVIAHRLPGFQPATLVGIWWVLYIVDLIFTRIVFQYTRRADGVDSLITATQLQLVGIAISLPAVVITIVMIKKMHAMEKELWEEAQQPGESVFSLMPEPVIVTGEGDVQS